MTLKERLGYWLFATAFKGIDVKDTQDIRQMSSDRYREYVQEAHSFVHSNFFRNEMKRLRLLQEKKIAQKVDNLTDLWTNKACLMALDTIEKRFVELAEVYDKMVQSPQRKPY